MAERNSATGRGQNPKSEARNPKQIQNPNLKCSKQPNRNLYQQCFDEDNLMNKKKTLVALLIMVPTGAAFMIAATRVIAVELPPVATAGQGGYLGGELIYALDDRPTPECHASTIVETSDGLVAAWFGGKHEKNPDVGIWVSLHRDGQWSKPVEVVNGVESPELRYPCWNPVLFQPRQGPLLLFYKVGPSPSRWWGMITTSQDQGVNWSTPRKLGQDDAIGHLLGPVKNKPIQLSNGVILCPSSSEHDGWRVHFERTADLGATWEVIGPINDGKEFGAIQPSILTYDDGRMQVLCRSRQGVITQSWSDDQGMTWSKMTATQVPNPNSGTDAVTLRDGRQLLVYNHTTRRGPFPSGRNMLNVAISRDGQQWSTVLTLEKQKGEYSYPAVIQTSDGKVHITYTYQRQSVKHVTLDPAEIR
jgi:predicted neuraminidase